MICYDCEIPIIYQATAANGDLLVHIYTCPKCGMAYETRQYKYTHQNCPKHQWEFTSWGFQDGLHTHKIYWRLQCDRCGKIEHKRWDSKEVGLRQAVEMEDPRVLKYLTLDENTARFILDDDEVKNFWE